MVCSIVPRYAFDTVSEQGFAISKRVAQGSIDPPDNATDNGERQGKASPRLANYDTLWYRNWRI